MINKIQIIPIFLYSVIFFLSCADREQLHVEGNLPIDSLAEVRLVNMMTGKQEMIDTVVPATFQVRVSNIPAGIYILEFLWDRHQLRPSEIKERARYQLEELPKYYVSKAIWVDQKSNQRIKLLPAIAAKQEQWEDVLLARGGNVAIDAEASQPNAQAFEEFLKIGAKYHATNRNQKDSITQLLYETNDMGNYKQSRTLHSQTGLAWAADVQQSMQREEIDYLTRHINLPIVPFILYSRIASKADFAIYQPVYDRLDQSVKEKIGVWFDQYRED